MIDEASIYRGLLCVVQRFCEYIVFVGQKLNVFGNCCCTGNRLQDQQVSIFRDCVDDIRR